MLRDIAEITVNLDEVAGSLLEGICFLREHNILSAELRMIDGLNLAQFSLEETKGVKRILDANGIKVAAIASPLFKWGSCSRKDELRIDFFGMDPHVSKMQKSDMIGAVIEQAAIMEAGKIRIFSGLRASIDYENLSDVEFSYEDSDLLFRALDEAKANGISLLLENEPVCRVSQLDDYIRLFTTGKYPGLRSWFDVANVYTQGGTIESDHLQRLSPYIDHLHIKDLADIGSCKCVPFGDGCIDYARLFTVMESFVEHPFTMSIETHVSDNKAAVMSISLAHLRDLLYRV